mgnify:CR=1 FL=1
MAKLITPEIFQKNTAEDYLKAAIDTAEWIDTLAIKTEYRDYVLYVADVLLEAAVGDENGRLIPYQDHPVTDPTYDKYYLSTCHGPVGSTLAFRELYEITGHRDFVPGMTVGGERSRPELSVIRDCMSVWQAVHPLCFVPMRCSQVRN